MNEHLKGCSFLEAHSLAAAEGKQRDIPQEEFGLHVCLLCIVWGRLFVAATAGREDNQSRSTRHPESGRNFNHGHGQNPHEPRKTSLEIIGCLTFGSRASLGSLPSQAAFPFNGRTRRDSKGLRAVPPESWQGLWCAADTGHCSKGEGCRA
jgi:hypothetical protein